MKINSLLESQTVSSAISNTTTSAPVFGRDEDRLEETTTSGSVATVASPVGKVQSRGSIFSGINTSEKFPNSNPVKEENLPVSDKKQKYIQAAKDVLKGADFDHVARVRNLDVEMLRKFVGFAHEKLSKGEYKLNRPNLEEQGVEEATGTLARTRDRLGLNAVPLQRSTDNWNDERDARHQSRLSDIERRTRYKDELSNISLDRERHRLARMQKDDDEWNDTFNAMRDRIRHRSNYQFGRENDPRLEQGVTEASFDYTMKDMGDDYAGFASNHSMKHKMLKRIKPEKQQLYKDKINNTRDWDNLFALFKVAKERGDIIEQGVAEAGQNFRRGNARRAALNAMSPEELKAYEEKRAEQQRKRDEARLERERQRNAAKKGVAEGKGDFAQAIENLHGWYEETSKNPKLRIWEFDDREGGYYAQGEVIYNTQTGRVKVKFEDRSGQYGDDIDQTFNSIGDAMNALRTLTTQINYNTGKAQNFDRLGHREPVGPDSLRKTDRTGRKGTLAGGPTNNLKYSIQHNKGRHGPKGVLPEQGMAEGYDTAEDYRAKAQWLMRTHNLRPDEAMEYAYYDTDPATWEGSPWEDDYKQGVAEEQINEINPHDFDSDEDYQNAVRKSKQKYHDDDFDMTDDDDFDPMDDESYYEKYVRTKRLEEKQRLDPKCWTGYKKQGTKMKGDTRVNNCVKVDEAEISEEMLAHELFKDLQIFKQGKDKTIGKKAKSKDISKKPEDRDIVVKEGTEMKASEILNEGKPGLWANIHAKRERIKSGSGERMRKPGSKGAPSAQDFKDAAKTEAANPAQQAAIAISMKKKGQKPKNENAEYDDEAGMADNNLETLERAVQGIDELINAGDNLPEWCQEKIAVSKSMLVTVWDYMKSEEDRGALAEEFDLIESIVEGIAVRNNVDSEAIWEDLESLTDDELYVFAVTSEPINEDWQKVNKKDKTDGMSPKAVKAYRRENPGSKLKTAVTTKPSKLKKGSKASKRRSSYCSRSRGQMKMHNISCSKTPDKAICKARRRWNC